MNKERRKFAVITLLVSIVLGLAGCKQPSSNHEHEIKDTVTNDYIGYAWERDHYYMLYGHYESKAGPMYESLGDEFCERVSFVIKQDAEAGEKYMLASFDVKNIDTYTEIMRHLYEPFNIRVEDITYSDGCTDRNLHLLGLVEEQVEE